MTLVEQGGVGSTSGDINFEASVLSAMAKEGLLCLIGIIGSFRYFPRSSRNAWDISDTIFALSWKISHPLQCFV